MKEQTHATTKKKKKIVLMVKLKILFSFMILDMVHSAWVCSLILLGANTLISPVSAISSGYDKHVTGRCVD